MAGNYGEREHSKTARAREMDDYKKTVFSGQIAAMCTNDSNDRMQRTWLAQVRQYPNTEELVTESHP